MVNLRSPGPQYDFIYNSPPKTTKKSKVGQLVLILVVGIIVLVLVVVIISLTKKKSTISGTDYIPLVGRSQEIIRVSELAKTMTKSSDTQTLIATTETALTSDNSNLLSYMSKNHVRVTDKDLLLYTNKQTDKLLTTASQNNSIDSAYDDYLKTQLNKYLQGLQSAYLHAGKNGKEVLSTAISSTNLLIASPQLTPPSLPQ